MGQNNSCENCLHAIVDLNDKALVYKCRRFPPQVVGGVVQSQMGVGFMAQASFPQVGKNDLCGEYAEKPPTIKMIN